MNVRRSLVLSLLVAIAAPAGIATSPAPAAGSRWTTYDRPAEFGVAVDKAVPIAMPDGTVLRANVYRPDRPGRYPVLLYQNAYGTNGLPGNTGGGSDPFLTERGYVQVVVDVRGTGESGGTWDPFGPLEQADGPVLVDWASKQSWSDGKVGTAGGSYLAITQLLTAARRPPALKATFPVVPVGDMYRDMIMTGGSADTAFIPAWTAVVAAGMVQVPPGVGPAGAFEFLLSRLVGVTTTQSRLVLDPLSGGEMAFDGPWYGSRSPLDVVDRIKVPTFLVGKLHDIFQRGEPLLYERLKRRVPTRLLTVPGYHTSPEGLPKDGVPDLKHLQLRWFDRWLKGIDTKIDAIPRVTQYRLGDGRYHVQEDWPRPTLRLERRFLRGGGSLSPQAPGAGETPQSFLQNPLSGACTLSTAQWTAGLADALPCTKEDDGRIDAALGSARFTSPPAERDLVLDGPILANLWIRTTARDAPLTVRVGSVAPDGSVLELTTGWLSASHRAVDRRRSRYVKGRLLQPWHPFTRAAALPVTPGEPVELPIEVFPTHAVIKKGHRLRIDVLPADFPHQLPPLPQLAGSLLGKVEVLTEPAHPSYVELPVAGGTCSVRPARTKAKGKAKAPGRKRPCKALPGPALLRPAG